MTMTTQRLSFYKCLRSLGNSFRTFSRMGATGSNISTQPRLDARCDGDFPRTFFRFGSSSIGASQPAFSPPCKFVCLAWSSTPRADAQRLAILLRLRQSPRTKSRPPSRPPVSGTVEPRHCRAMVRISPGKCFEAPRRILLSKIARFNPERVSQHRPGVAALRRTPSKHQCRSFLV